MPYHSALMDGEYIPLVHYQYEESVNEINRKTNGRIPGILLILGSGLGFLAEELEDAVEIPYHQIPHFATATAPGHAGKLCVGKLSGVMVAVMQGRFHLYEGFSAEMTAIPIRVAKMLGCRSLLVTNAAGGVNLSFNPGDLMLIRDHIKLFDASPLAGKNLPEFGVRFPDMSAVYTPEYLDLARGCANRLGLALKEGVYFYFPGPQYETPAEVKAARLLGGDAVGMSTVPEVIAARHCGMRVLGLSLISNLAAGVSPHPLSEAEVLEAGKAAAPKFSALIRACVAEMKETAE